MCVRIVTLALALGVIAAGQTPLLTFRGAVDLDYAGVAVASPGDLDGDGIGDLLYGEDGWDGSAGLECGRVTAISGADGSVIYRLEGPTAGEWFGYSLAGIGDVDGDGIVDWIGGSPYGGVNGPNSGTAHVVTGRKGAIIRTHSGAPDTSGDGYGDYLGYVLSGGRDIDGDTWPDYLIGSPGDRFDGSTTCSTITQGGRVDVFSGLTGAVIHSIVGAPFCMGAGVACSGLPDLNGDNQAEFLLGFPMHTGHLGRIEVRDGQTATVLRTHWGFNAGDLLGTWVAELGDVDGDGTPDYGGHAENWLAPQTWGIGYFQAHSGATGALIQRYQGNMNNDSYGFGAGDAGDYDGDGYDDLFIAAPWDSAAGTYAGRVAIVSGLTGAPLFQVFGEAPNDLIGIRDRCAVINDLDGDGKVELIAATWTNDRYGMDRGIVTVHSSQQRPHWLSQNLISIANPGRVQFEVQGPANAVYVVLGSLTGSSPATVFGSYAIPLVNDAWFALTFDPQTSPFTNPIGWLNPQGRGTAYFDVPAGLPPSLSGLTHWSAAVTFDPQTQSVVISGAARFHLAP